MATNGAPSPVLSTFAPDWTTSFVALNAFLVFFMQVGFVVLETGSSRAKNAKNILMKNMVDVMICALAWWAVGYALAYGASAGGIIGATDFFYQAEPVVPDASLPERPWFFSWTFAVACVTIVSGCLAERTQLAAYPCATLVITILVHPLIAHWVWVPTSWVNRISTCRVLDYAGGTAVHMVGGLFGLVGAVLCGPRLGRFDEGAPKEMPGHDMAFVTLGTFMLWYGWYGFNSGSVFIYSHPSGFTTRLVNLNTTLAASTAGLVALAVHALKQRTYDVRVACNGVLSGLVVITPMCGFVAPWAAFVAGAIAGACYVGHSWLLLRMRVDDPMDSAPVHWGNGLIGTFLLSFMAKPEYVALLTNSTCGGIFYTSMGWLQMGMQLLAIVLTGVVTCGFSLAVFLVLRRLNMLRVGHATELAGIDNIDHGGPAYPELTAAATFGNAHAGIGVYR